MKSKGYRPKKELTMKQKLTGTLLCVLLYRLLSFVPLPFADRSYIQAAIGANGSLGLLDILSGGGLGNLSLTALGVGPWITASIVLQLIGAAFPSFAELNKEESGRKTYRLITFTTAASLALAESFGLMYGYGRAGYLSGDAWYTVAAPAFLMAAGTGFLSLMCWYIDERLFGNGTSVILTAGILCSYAGDGAMLVEVLVHGKRALAGAAACAAALAALIGLFAYTVFISSCEKRIHVVYSKKAPGAGMKNTNTIPLKLISGGVVPVIFASTIITFPALVGTMAGSDAAWLKVFNTGCWLDGAYPWASLGFVLYIGLIMVFCYFCQVMYVNPVELAENLKKNGGTVPGVRPGKPTADYITGQARWLTALGGIFLCVIAAVPIAVSGAFGVGNLSFLGTSILITVSTIDESWKTWKAANLGNSYSVKKGIL